MIYSESSLSVVYFNLKSAFSATAFLILIKLFENDACVLTHQNYPKVLVVCHATRKKFHKCNVLSKTTSLVTSIFHHLKVHTQSCLDNAPLVSIGGYALRVRIPHWIMKHFTENDFISLTSLPYFMTFQPS